LPVAFSYPFRQAGFQPDSASKQNKNRVGDELSRTDQAVEIQREYYTETASRYDTMHKHEGVDDAEGRRLILSVLRSLEVRSFLDVGSATGRGLKEFASALPGALVCGVEPVAALVQQGVAAGNTETVSLMQASGDALPFADASFDVVSEFSTLHHVPEPSRVVSEMLRVARRAVVIVDSNRFGQGTWPARIFKLILYKIGLWNALNFVRTGGRRYQISEGDGLFYSYSVYDSYAVVAQWADRILLLSNGPIRSRSWFHPLLTAEGLILIAIREPRGGQDRD
jgi:ubiquinone/menaquinone biosynthesis C-methylase UbiE